MLKSEFLKFTRSKFLTCVTLVMLVLTFIAGTREAEMRYGLLTNSQILSYYDGSSVSSVWPALRITVTAWALDPEKAEQEIDVERAKLPGNLTVLQEDSRLLLKVPNIVHEEQYKRMFNVSLGFILLATFFAPYYIGMDFATRLWNNKLYIGHSRASVYWSRWTMYLIIVALASLLTSLITIFMYAGTIFDKIPFSIIVNDLVRKFIFDMSIMSIPIIFIYLFKGAVFPSIITFVIGMSFWISTLVYGAPATAPVIAMTPYATPVLPQYLPTFDIFYDIHIVVPVLIIAASAFLGWYFFERCDLD